MVIPMRRCDAKTAMGCDAFGEGRGGDEGEGKGEEGR